MHFERTLREITGLLETNPNETTKHSLNTLLEDSLGEHDYSDSDILSNTILFIRDDFVQVTESSGGDNTQGERTAYLCYYEPGPY